jgi:ubiquinone/menaquinone biosynthesis C-methylase UbiE
MVITKGGVPLEEPFPEEFCAVSASNGVDLLELWNTYAIAGYEKIYQARITQSHRQELGKLFLPSGGVCLDAGCGTGNLFDLIVQRIQPRLLYGVDWSEAMLAEAKLESERLSQNCRTQFKIRRSDLAKPWLCPDNYFDGVISNQVINYLPCGWQFPFVEMCRIIKPGGYLYLGTFLRERKVWSLSNLVKHAPTEFLSNPIVTLKELGCLKYRTILLKIEKGVREKSVESPSYQEIINFLETCGFEEITVTPTYWGGGLVLRSRVSLKPLS